MWELEDIIELLERYDGSVREWFDPNKIKWDDLSPSIARYMAMYNVPLKDWWDISYYQSYFAGHILDFYEDKDADLDYLLKVLEESPPEKYYKDIWRYVLSFLRHSYNDLNRLLDLLVSIDSITLQFLIKNYGDKISIWWNSDKFEWDGTHSYELAKYISPNDFKIWWDPDKFEWYSGLPLLIEYQMDNFEIWWDPTHFDIKYLDELYKKIPERIDEYFLPQLIKSNADGVHVLEVIHDVEMVDDEQADGLFKKAFPHIKKILDKNDSMVWWNLLTFFKKYFDIWWDPDKFNWTYVTYLVKNYSEYFDKWWDPGKYEWSPDSIYDLTVYCSDTEEMFNNWWDPKICWIVIYRNKELIGDFIENVLEYKDIWNPNV